MSLEKALKLKKEADAIYKDFGIISLNPGYDEGVHLRVDCFMKTFGDEDIEISERNDDVFPYRAQAQYKGVEWFCLITKKQIEEYKLEDRINGIEKVNEIKKEKDDIAAIKRS